MLTLPLVLATSSGAERATSSVHVVSPGEVDLAAARTVATGTSAPPTTASTTAPTTAVPTTAPTITAVSTTTVRTTITSGVPAPADESVRASDEPGDAWPASPTSTVPVTTTTAAPRGDLPAAGRNGPGHFSGRILRDGRPLPGVTVKVVNVATPGWPRTAVLDSLGGHDGIDVFVTTTDASGDWSVTGLAPTKQFMLKVFPPSICDAFAEIAPAYVTAEAGFIDVHGNPFLSTRSAPGAGPYQRWSSGRYLFDMPVHVYPTVAGALEGARGYSDLNIRFSTRPDGFATSAGPVTGCGT